jgi:rubrerythrin
MTREEKINLLNKLLEIEEKLDIGNLTRAEKGEFRQWVETLRQKPRTGKWIEHFDEIGKWYECDQCHTDWGGAVNFCPNCGAKMAEQEG